MSLLRLLLYRLAVLVTIFTAFIRHVGASDIAYCSVLNTASTNANSSIYQSNGLCHDFCLSNYAFAVLQDQDCWCSNYVPAPTSPTSSCNLKCPGYPGELCGGVGLFGYIALNKRPSGTAAVSGTSATQVSSKPQSVYVPPPPRTTVSFLPSPSKAPTSTPQIAINPSTPSSSTDSPSGSSATKPPSTSPSLTPIVTVQTITGQVRTVTYTPTASPTFDSSTAGAFEQNPGQNLTTAQAVGLTVGLVALVAIIGALIFVCVRRRRRLKEEAYDQPTPVPSGSSFVNGSSNGGVVQRAMSQNSRFMLGTDGRQVVEGWEAGSDTPGSRRSRLMPVDPRLDPFAPVYLRGDGSKSRESVTTLQDNHDYSRRVHQQKPILRATNPD